MKPIEFVVHLPFSYWLGQDPQTEVLLKTPTSQGLLEYLACLSGEISSMKEDFEDCEVRSIRFQGGYLSLLDAEDLNRLLITIHRSLSVQKHCPVNGIMFPGHLDMEKFSAYQNRKIRPLIFEVPSLSFNECRRWKYPVILQALDKTVSFLQSFREEEWGLYLPIGIPGRTQTTWQYLLGQIYHYHPKYLIFQSIHPEMKEDPAFDLVCSHLQEHGYNKGSGFYFSLSKEIPQILRMSSREAEYLGAGIGAKSRIDGFLVRNTSDWAVYKKMSSCYRRLITEVKEEAQPRALPARGVMADGG